MDKKAAFAPGTQLESSAALGYSVIARRYRPQQFAELIGQEATAQALVNALKSNRVAHAYLFTGTRGTGKTSAARILAKALNCVQGPTPTPCDQCESCQAIAVGEDVDVQEIDGASNRNLDDIRELRANVQYRPSRSRFKIYIIDEVHQLTKESFNALLKTLEEPPPHVKFIFATTDVQRVPVTILSRCQRFDFTGISVSAIARRLAEIVTAEGRAADAEALELLARRAGGSMRDAQSLLDQLLAFGGERLTADMVHQLLGTSHEDQVAGLAAAVLDRRVAEAMALFDQACERGVQIGELLDQLIEYWRDLMLLKSAGSDFPGLNFPPRFRPAMQEQAAELSLESILAGLDILSAARSRLRFSSHGRTLFEMTLVRLGRLEDLAAIAEIAQLLQDVPANARPATPRPAAASGDNVKKNLCAPEPPQPAGSTANVPPLEMTDANLPEIWRRTLASVGPMFASELGRGSPAISGPNILVVRFSARYNKEKERCQDSAKVELLQQVMSKIVGSAVAVRFDSLPGESVPESESRTETKAPRMKQLREIAAKVPLVRRAIEDLSAQLLPTTDEGFGQGDGQDTETER